MKFNRLITIKQRLSELFKVMLLLTCFVTVHPLFAEESKARALFQRIITNDALSEQEKVIKLEELNNQYAESPDLRLKVFTLYHIGRNYMLMGDPEASEHWNMVPSYSKIHKIFRMAIIFGKCSSSNAV